MDIGFTGTRDGMTWAQQAALDEMLQLEGLRFHHGDCIGADAEAHELAWKYDKHIVIHPPTDDRLRARCVANSIRPERPYHERNRNIVQESDLLIACPKQSTEQFQGGTWYTIHYAQGIGKIVRIIWPDGSVEGR